MVSANGYDVDPDQVDDLVRTMFSQIDEFGALCRQFGQLVPPVAAFGLIGSPTGAASMTAHQMLQQAQRALELVLNRATENVQTAMNNYRQTSRGGVSRLAEVTAALNAATGLIRRLQSTGLGSGGIHSYLQDQGNQVGAGLAEVHVGSNLGEVRLRPGDVVTTATFTATVGTDGRLYANGQPAEAPGGQEARVYRTMPGGAATR